MADSVNDLYLCEDRTWKPYNQKDRFLNEHGEFVTRNIKDRFLRSNGTWRKIDLPDPKPLYIYMYKSDTSHEMLLFSNTPVSNYKNKTVLGSWMFPFDYDLKKENDGYAPWYDYYIDQCESNGTVIAPKYMHWFFHNTGKFNLSFLSKWDIRLTESISNLFQDSPVDSDVSSIANRDPSLL